ncbi:unnamed protein product [Nezara viridula]|uniref:PHD-type domain-containing protein n=1 Tax=Nezara viridula TaxID=85310 RepID=A0A9P0E2Y8_NEZVI|nr:unnamed protein product [Nezara viridula]
MEVEIEKPIHEKIIAVQNQLRIAIQNHHMLVLRKKNFPLDNELNTHLNVIQFLIINMGRAQAELMTRFRQEIAAKYDVKPNSPVVSTVMKKFLLFPEAPKNIPVYKPVIKTNNDEKKISSWRPKAMKSLLRVNNNDNSENNKFISIGNQKVNASDVTVDGSKIKIVYKGKKESSNSLLVQQPKKLQSVLKSKNVKANSNDKNESVEEGRNSPESCSSSSGSDLKSKISSRSNSPVEDNDVIESPTRRMDTRYGRKYEAKMLGKTKIKILCDNQNNSVKKNVEVAKDSSGQEWKHTLPVTRAKSINQEPVTIDELDKEIFLGFFGLVSKEKCEVLKRKRCERKRRSVAGQSSLYSDYFQPQPKRTYTPRKPPVPVANSNAVIVESPPVDDDEDEKPTKTNSCIICHEEGILEVCNSCSEMYHYKCIPASNKGYCPNCMAQTTNIPSIVGANNSAGNASSLELIKRYSNDEQSSG